MFFAKSLLAKGSHCELLGLVWGYCRYGLVAPGSFFADLFIEMAPFII